MQQRLHAIMVRTGNTHTRYRIVSRSHHVSHPRIVQHPILDPFRNPKYECFTGVRCEAHATHVGGGGARRERQVTFAVGPARSRSQNA